MKRFNKIATVVAALCFATPAIVAESQAQDRVTLGWGRTFVNDQLGDFQDRWRTSSYTLSLVRGPAWQGSLPQTFGEILEFRGRAEIISPADLTQAPPGDRRYAAILSLGLHTHFDLNGLETSLGVDLAMTGPQTGLSNLQSDFHRLVGLPQPLVAEDQLPNGFYPTLVAEMGSTYPFGANGTIRPFVEAQVGIETFVRAGFDMWFGRFGDGALMLREQVTGQRYRAVMPKSRTPGFTFTLGGDAAHVFESRLLPDGGDARLNAKRVRLRAGLAWQNERSSVFFGVTWLGEEFESQPEGQLVGMLNLRIRF